MTTDQWMTLGIYTASVVFTVVGWLIVREIRANDRRFDKLEKDCEKVLQESSRTKNQVRLINMFLSEKGVMPRTIPFPSPPPAIEDSE